MNTKLATREFRIQQWTGIIQDCVESGLKVDDYCLQHGITHHQYYYWLRKVKESALEVQRPTFVEFKAPEPEPEIPDTNTSSAKFIPQLTVEVGNICLGINSNTPPELLLRVMEVLSNA